MTVITNDKGLKSYTKGASEIIISRCKYIKIGDKIYPFTDNKKSEIKSVIDKMTDKALRVMGFCYKTFDNLNMSDDLEQDMVFLGLVGLMDNPRPEVKDSIQKCFKAGLKPIMITGDHKRPAYAIANELKIATNIKQIKT